MFCQLLVSVLLLAPATSPIEDKNRWQALSRQKWSESMGEGAQQRRYPNT